MSVFMESSFDLSFGTFDSFERAMRRFIPALTAEGWRLIAALRNTTGNISRATHLWELPDHDSLTSAGERAIAANPALLEDIALAAKIVRTERIRFLTPLAVDPSVTDTRPEPAAPLFQRVAFDLEFGSLERFESALHEVVPALSAQGWRLIGSFRNETGNVHSATNLWALPNLESVFTAGLSARAANPDLDVVVAELATIIRTETVDLLVALAHHPAAR
jgi:superoxide dismutase